MKKDLIVVTLKLKTGDDIIGYYLDEGDSDSDLGPSIVLHRPLKIRQVMILDKKGTQHFHYVCDIYSLFGLTGMVTIPYSEVISRDVASEFFKMYYERNLGSLISYEDSIQESYIKFYEKQDLKEIMSQTDSHYIVQETEFLQ